MNSMMSPIVLVENGPSTHVKLTSREQHELQVLSETWKSRLGLKRLPFVYESGYLSARDVTGFVQLSNLPIEVAPKFLTDGVLVEENWRAAIWSILARTYRVPILAGLSVGSITSKRSLADLLGYVLLASIRETRAQGWPAGYVVVVDRSRVLRGKLVQSHIIESILRPGWVTCEYEEYSRDIPANRLVKWASEQIAVLARSPVLSRDLIEEAQALREVATLPPSPRVAERIVLSPMNQTLAPAVRVGQVLLTGRSLQHGGGGERLPGFLWNSSDVFERFAKELIRRAIRLLPASVQFADSALILGEPSKNGRSLPTTPDVRLLSQGAHIAVLDAKYKVWSGSPSAPDSYQVVAGGWVADSPEVGLIYPTPSPERKLPVEWILTGRDNPKRLWAAFLNLVEMADPRGEECLVDQLLRDLRHILEP